MKRLEKGLNPSFVTGRDRLTRYDIWEKKERWNFKSGDTTKLMIRMLLNYQSGTHQLEFLPNENLKIIEPYLGEFTLITPENQPENSSTKINFKIYDWLRRDTFKERFILFAE